MDKKPLSRTAKYYRKVPFSKRHGGNIDIYELIAKYRDYDCLWNIHCEKYRHNSLKQRAWEYMARHFDTEVSALKKKIKNLRSAYVMEKKKVDASKKSGLYPLYKPGLFYYNYLTFLDDIVVCRNPIKFKRKSYNETSNDMDYDNEEISQDCEEQNGLEEPITKIEIIEPDRKYFCRQIPQERYSELISMYKDNECLWNYRNEKDYKNKPFKQKAWERLARHFDTDVISIKKKIRNLRIAYGTEKKKLDKNPQRVPNLFYYDDFSFLENYLKANETNEFEKTGSDMEFDNTESVPNNGIDEYEIFTKTEDVEFSPEQLSTPLFVRARFNSNIDRRELILKYKEHECLWNSNIKDYNNITLNQSAWENIARHFNAEVSVVKTKLRHLRSTYVGERKQVEMSKKKGENPPYEPSLFYYKDFNFLDKVVVLRPISTDSDLTPEQEYSQAPLSAPSLAPKDYNLSVLELISKYRSYKCLWDINSKSYRNIGSKLEAWESIARHFGSEVSEVKTKIKNLRSAYVSEKKKVDKSKKLGENPTYIPALYYYKHLNFLDNIVILRKETDEIESDKTKHLEKTVGFETSDSFETSKDMEFENVIIQNSEPIDEFDPIAKTEDIELEQPSDQEHSSESSHCSQQDLNTSVPTIVSTRSLKAQSTQGQSQKQTKLNNAIENLERNNVYTSFGKTIALQLKQLRLDEASIAMLEIHKILTKKILEHINSTNNESTHSYEEQYEDDIIQAANIK